MTFTYVRARATSFIHNFIDQNSINTNVICNYISELELRLRQRLALSFEGDLPALKIDDSEGELALDCEMVASEEYADLYTYYVAAKSFLKIGEYDRYNNYILLHKEVYDTFMREYAQRHMPKPVYLKY